MKKEALYRISSVKTDNIIRVIGLIIAGVILYNYHLNPMAFLIISILIILLILVYRSSYIEVNKSCFTLYKSSPFLPFFKGVRVFNFNEVQKVEYQKGSMVIEFLSLIFVGVFGSPDKFIEVYYENGDYKKIDIRGVNSYNLKKCLELINQYCKRRPSQQ